MRSYGKVSTAFFTDDKIMALSDSAKVLAVYFLAGPHSNHLGCFRAPDGYILADLGWHPETLSETLSELFRIGFCYRCRNTGWTVIFRYLKWNPIENPNVAKSLHPVFGSVPKNSECFQHIVECVQRYAERYAEGFGIPYGKHGDGDGDGDGDGREPLLNGSKPISKSKQTEAEIPKPKSKRCPKLDELELDDELRGLAEREGKNPERQLERFRNYCGAKGKTYRDYRAAFRNWLTSEFDKPDKQPPSPRPKNPKSNAVDDPYGDQAGFEAALAAAEATR